MKMLYVLKKIEKALVELLDEVSQTSPPPSPPICLVSLLVTIVMQMFSFKKSGRGLAKSFKVLF